MAEWWPSPSGMMPPQTWGKVSSGMTITSPFQCTEIRFYKWYQLSYYLLRWTLFHSSSHHFQDNGETSTRGPINITTKVHLDILPPSKRKGKDQVLKQKFKQLNKLGNFIWILKFSAPETSGIGWYVLFTHINFSKNWGKATLRSSSEVGS